MGCVLQQSGHGHSHGGLSSKHSHSHEEEDGHGHSHGKKVNINVRAAFIHVLGDLVQSIGVLIAAVIIKVQVFSLHFTLYRAGLSCHVSFKGLRIYLNTMSFDFRFKRSHKHLLKISIALPKYRQCFLI